MPRKTTTKKPTRASKPKPKTWRVTFEVERVKVLVGLKTAKEAEERAREEVLFGDELPLDREEIGDVTVRWVDDMNVGHVEECEGAHCKHYDCEVEAGVPYYCTTCDPECQ